MFLAGPNQKVVARSQRHRGTVKIGEGGISLQQNDPLIPILIVPLTGGRGLSGGDDAFDADAIAIDEGFKQLPGGKFRRQIEQIFHQFFGRKKVQNAGDFRRSL